MLSQKVVTRENVADVVHYYEDGVDDYYAKKGQGSSWQGKGALALGLSGPVDAKRFHELLAGEVEGHGRSVRKSTRDDSRNRLGIDLTFSAPKSVSIQALVAGDGRLVLAHDRAVQRALQVIEEHAQARQKVKGRSRVESTRNLVVATFRHETSRAQDPQLHTHAVVMNLTRRKDGTWRALKNDEIVKATKYFGAVYRAELALELEGLGYGLRYSRGGLFELAHVSREQLTHFSQRGEEIERLLGEKGLDRSTATPAQKQLAALATRPRKSKVERDLVFQEWRSRAAELGIGLDWQAGFGGLRGEMKAGSARERLREVVRRVLGRAPEAAGSVRTDQVEVKAAAARRAVRYAVNHLSERSAVIEERELLTTAMNHALGAVNDRDVVLEVERLRKTGFLIRGAQVFRPADAEPDAPALARAGWIEKLVKQGLGLEEAIQRVDDGIRVGSLVRGDARYTTQTALARERRILKLEREGRGQVAAILPAEEVRTKLADSGLTEGQKEAVLAITTSQDRIIGIQGRAGTGKSHMLQEARDLVEVLGRSGELAGSASYEVRAVAPYSTQVKALRELGMKAQTVAAFLGARERPIDARTVLVVDEAGTVPTRQMEQLLQLAVERGARVVLVGDTQQTKAIEAGRPFQELQAEGMRTVAMSDIQRQKDERLREAVELAAAGRTSESLGKLRDVIQVKDPHERRAAVAADFARLSEAERARTIIVSGTNEARREINEGIRERLGLAGKGLRYETLVRRDTTREERAFARNYDVGDVIQPERDYPRSGLERGALYQVVELEPGNRLRVRDEEGREVTFCPRLHRQLSVYEPSSMELAPGDRVRVTRNDAALDLANGDRLEVLKVTKESIALSDGHRVVQLPAESPLHLDHAYATTVHSSQGVTADRVLFDASTKSKTTSQDVYYVAISRARLEARIYTDDLENLPRAIARENVKHTGLDLHRSRQPQLVAGGARR